MLASHTPATFHKIEMTMRTPRSLFLINGFLTPLFSFPLSVNLTATGFTIMMRPAPVCLLALTTTIWAGDAFVIPRSARHCAFAVSAASPAEEHLEELSESWNKLKEKEKEVERTQDDVS